MPHPSGIARVGTLRRTRPRRHWREQQRDRRRTRTPTTYHLRSLSPSLCACRHASSGSHSLTPWRSADREREERESGSGVRPTFEVIDAARVLRLESIVPDWRDLEERCGINATPSNKPHVPDELCRERLWTCFIRGRHARPSVPNDVDERVLIEQRCVWRPGSG